MGVSSNSNLNLLLPTLKRQGWILSSAALLIGVMVAVFDPVHWIVSLLAVIAAVLIVASLVSVKCWFYLYLASVLIVPPLYFSSLGGSFPVYVPTLLLVVGVFVTLLHYADLKRWWDLTETTGTLFLVVVAMSLPFSFWFSGVEQGIQSCLRFLLLLQPFVVFLWLREFDFFSEQKSKDRVTLCILCLGGLAAAYGIYDFYYPVPIPHPFADQYIYLWGKMIRRAQGFLSEASNFGNLCAFLLALASCFLVSQWRRLGMFQRSMLSLMVGLFVIALFLAYSRGSWANLLVSLVVFFFLQRKRPFMPIVSVILLAVGFLWVVFMVSPDVFMNFFNWRLWSLLEFWRDPNFATSGRWETWKFLAAYFADHPWLLIFGIGYKSLPTTSLLGRDVIADNGYLSMTCETGVLGLIAFLSFNVVLFRTLYKKMARNSGNPNFHAQFMFAFWAGEMVQMLTGDILTYWRNLILFFTLIAMAQASDNAEADSVC